MTDEAADELAKLLVKLAGSGNLAANALRKNDASSSQQRELSNSKSQQRK